MREKINEIVINKKISTLYQPILNSDLEIKGYEALSRIKINDLNI